jgi:hypothetical protein
MMFEPNSRNSCFLPQPIGYKVRGLAAKDVMITLLSPTEVVEGHEWENMERHLMFSEHVCLPASSDLITVQVSCYFMGALSFLDFWIA